MDTLTPDQRHKNMVAIRSKDTSIELILRKALYHRGFRYRKNYKELPGSPDIAITKHRIAIFCDSEFFHGKDWEALKLRLENGNNSTCWIKKITRNMERDKRKRAGAEIPGMDCAAVLGRGYPEAYGRLRESGGRSGVGAENIV